jgi:hypothetical protein
MKTNVLAFVLGLITISTFAQKNELKIAEKAIKSSDYTNAVTAVLEAESLFANMDNKTKAKFYFLKAQAFYGKKEFQIATDTFEELFNFENAIGKKKYSDQASEIKSKMVQMSRRVISWPIFI